MVDHTVNKAKGIPDFPYISFDKAYALAENLIKSGGYAKLKEFYELIGRKKTGWLGLEIKSMKVWGLVVSEKGTMKLTEQFYQFSSTNDQIKKLLIKKQAFLKIPLFIKLFEIQKTNKFLDKKSLSEYLEKNYGINPTYCPGVAKAFLESIKEFSTISEREVVDEPKVNLEPFLEQKKISSLNLRVISEIGNFDLDISTDEEFDKAINILNLLRDKRKNVTEKQN